MKTLKKGCFLFPILLILGCGVNPEPIYFGKDPCFNCKMNIVDPKFGGELVTTKGKVYKFDALECMVAYMEQLDQDYAYVLGIAYDKPEMLVEVDKLQFIISEDFNSPMGANLAAFSQIKSQYKDQEIFDWQDLRSHLSKKNNN